MPADRLIPDAHPYAPDTTGRAVLDVLAGQPLADAAQQSGLDSADLADAVAVFQQAGHEALARQAARTDWQQVYLHFTDWGSAEDTAAAHLAPLLRRAEDDGTISGWWFTRKHPCWRLRLSSATAGMVGLEAALDSMVDDGHLRRWWPGIYEPETAGFGGPAGMTAAHQLFTADSREILRLPGRHDLVLGRRELSILLCTIMLRAAGCEWYEQGDVWQRVISEEQRSHLHGIDPERLRALSTQLRSLLIADTDPSGPLLSNGGPLEPIAGWAAAFHHTGLALATAVRDGRLDRGLRRVLSLHVIFHWNRCGFSMGTQSALAWAARTAILDPAE